MTEQPGPQQRIADAIRPAMLDGLQDAELIGAPGAVRINQWVDWIAAVVAGHVVGPIAAERDAFADRVDTLTEVARRHKEGYREAARDVQLLEARVAELEAEVARLREPGGPAGDQEVQPEVPPVGEDTPAQSLRDRLLARYPATAEALDRRASGNAEG
ncbi:hypothetical protein CFP65_7386 [Kitasatospora sp. MMS16-BH015]|uniref:hypothetical protein n=1 Tax=Kitasatospora sp. MMS16-BH015 TaxID=2018025 RepID=UPI000CA260B9|nr:hypothetical protein [Kitasatospora sp. MMS16-BH015]AUG81967.1 hypothetical protein CFP65_7386 [Kitasatospora sp. MMS16-BH015]